MLIFNVEVPDEQIAKGLIENEEALILFLMKISRKYENKKTRKLVGWIEWYASDDDKINMKKLANSIIKACDKACDKARF